GVGDDATRRNYDRCERREAVLERCRLSARKNDTAITRAVGREYVVLLDWVVVRVRVVGERRIAHAKAGPEYGLLVPAICDADARREIFIMPVESKVLGIPTDARDDQAVGGRIVLGESVTMRWRRWRVEFPTEAEVDRQFGSHLPL